jgi:uncharacterized protein YndB with AHSA1/START domain
VPQRKRRIALGVIFVVASLVILPLAGMWVAGSMLPLEHTAEVAVRFNAPPEGVFDVLADVKGYPAWVPGVSSVERLADRSGQEVWRQRMGHNSFVLMTSRLEPPSVIVREVEDDNGAFSGSWELRVEGVDSDCRVRITERGRVFNPLARFIVQKLTDPRATARAFLESLATRFGQTPRWE